MSGDASFSDMGNLYKDHWNNIRLGSNQVGIMSSVLYILKLECFYNIQENTVSRQLGIRF